MILPLLLCLLAQDPQAPTPVATPVIKSTVRVVQVSVVVHDKKGQPVSDLTKDDFVVYDKGQLQKVQYFSLESNRPKSIPTSLAPGVVSNRLTGADPQHRAVLPTAVTMVLMDGLNTRFADRQLSEQALLHFMANVRPNDPVVVYTLTDHLSMVPTGNMDTMKTNLEKFLTQSNFILNFDQHTRVQTTLEALKKIASNVNGIPGRKNLVWLTDGFPILSGLGPTGRPGRNFESFADDVRKAMQALDHANVAIYPVDARGVISTFDTNPSTQPAQRSSSRRGAQRQDAMAQQDIQMSEGTMVDVADLTGGRAFMGSNDLSDFIHQAVEDTRVSYLIAYSPTHDEWNGRFRDIKVKVKRSGVDVRARKGYYAYPQTAADESATRESAMTNAMESPLESTGLGMMAKVITPPTAEHPQTRVTFVVDTNDLSFHLNEAGMWIADMDLMIVIRDDKGMVLHHMASSTQATLKQDQYDQIKRSGALALSADVETPEHSANARVVMRDSATGMLGSVDLPIPNNVK